MPATSSFEGRLLHEKAELEGRLLEGEETIRALSELIDLLPDDQFRGLRIQWHNAKARGDKEGNAVLRDIVNEYRRTLHGADYEDTKGELEDATDRVAELEAELEEMTDERNGHRDEAYRLELELDETKSDLNTAEYNLKEAEERIEYLEDELRNQVQKGGNNV